MVLQADRDIATIVVLIMNNEELAKLLRKIIREEIEVEAKRTHSDIHMLKLEVRTGLSKVTDRVKDVEISHTRLEKKIDHQGEQIMDAIAVFLLLSEGTTCSSGMAPFPS
jgi:hypothetical protein